MKPNVTFQSFIGLVVLSFGAFVMVWGRFIMGQ